MISSNQSSRRSKLDTLKVLAMWDKFRTPTEDKENQISRPKLIETTYDESRLNTLPTVDEARKISYSKDAPVMSPFPL